ncbi:MAG: sulfatase [Planctomycetaceae bacterium]|nr:sulfatase [Planctomycetaceae bacterium]
MPPNLQELNVPSFCVWNPVRLLAACVLLIVLSAGHAPSADTRPNILFCIADDWGYPYASAYGDRAVQTPTFDRLAREGLLFTHAFTASPSCTPSRSVILTGQWHWRLESCASNHSTFLDRFPTYVEILERSGYATGVVGKNWGPGRLETPNRPLAGHPSKSFREFLTGRPTDRPFCFWLGSGDPHRPFEAGAGQAAGIDLAAIKVPACWPDNELVRSDLADYEFEVRRFDALIGDAVAALESAGLLDQTLIVMTGDHGLPFPRGKANIYDLGVRVPLAMHYPPMIAAGRISDDFISLSDLAPTFLELAGLPIPEDMTGRSLAPILSNSDAATITAAPAADYVIFGKERHVPSQPAPDMGGYPCRGIRTREYLYIRNFRPDRWPNGTPDYAHAAIPGAWCADTDNGPTKAFIIENADRDDEHRRAFELSFGFRPTEELYDLKTDPEQLTNVAADPQYLQVRDALWAKLHDDLERTGDPRVTGGGYRFDDYPYFGKGPKHPNWEQAHPSE